MSCGPGDPGAAPSGGIQGARIVIGGPNDSLVSIVGNVGDPVGDGDTRWTAGVKIQNKLAQPMATTSDSGAALTPTAARDGPEDVIVVITDGPNCTGANCGTVSVATEDGTTSCATGGPRPFYGYNGGSVASGDDFNGVLGNFGQTGNSEETELRPWEFTLSNSNIMSFDFTVFVCAEVPHPNSVITWRMSLDATGTTPPADSVTDISGVDANTIWAVGGATSGGKVGGVIYKTTDGGTTWNVQGGPAGEGGNTITGPLTDIHAVDATTAFAVSDSAKFWRTTDGGTTWTESTVSNFPEVQGQTATSHLWAVWAADANTIYIAGEAAGTTDPVMKSTDGGDSFTRQAVGSGNLDLFIKSIWGVSSQEAWAAGRVEGGDGSRIFHTTDGGTNWTAQAHPSINAVTKVHGTSNTDVWASGRDSAVFHYDGNNWTRKMEGMNHQAWMDPGTNDIWISVFAIGASDVFALDTGPGGNNNDVAHYNGTAWVGMPSSREMSTSSFPEVKGAKGLDLWASGPTDVWIAVSDNPNVTGTVVGVVHGMQ